MTVCYFGIYNPTYTQNLNLINGLRENGVKVIECNTREMSNKKYFQLIKKHWQIRKDYQLMIVGFPGHTIMPLAWILAKLHRKKIIFNAFVSLYNTNIFDRKVYPPKSLKARYNFFLDKFSCKLANLVLLDTQSQIDYFVETFKTPRDKFRRVFVGSDDKVFYPKNYQGRKDNFIVHFHGYLVPFHGVEYIIEAAKILEGQNIIWQIVTRFDGKYEKLKQQVESLGLKNIIFYQEVPPEKLNDFINQADICLGVFGDSPKTQLVIPNKIFEALACQKPMITAQSKACREILTDKINCLFCQVANAEDLANKILELKNNFALREKIAANGYALYKENLIPKNLIKKLLANLNL